ncbi:MAG: LysE family transporter [Ignavibacteriaceae bacterium]|jgi:threonine/homoserine/homoserine lactone efflux protein|nr:LysE family transporter [Ignavibacteriaceae bacterium]MCW9065170.1 LysE family transporter [Ignavibacteriaceae bacterium]
MFVYLFFGTTYALAAAIQPGPFQTFIISKTLENGWKKTLPAAFAPVISDGPIIVLVLFILSKIPPELIRFLQIGGGLLLLYLAYSSFNSFLNFEKLNKPEENKTDSTLLKAVLVNLLNPAPYIGWSLIMGPMFIKGYRESTVNGIVLIAGFYITIVLCQMGIILLFGLARNLGPKVTRITLGIAASGLAAFGVYLLWQGVFY